MPFKPAENPKCSKCCKSVYAAEERVAGGHKFHKGCFKCGMCGKFLDSTNCAEHEAELYCKNCHGRKYGPKGYGFGGGAGCMSMDTGEQFKTEPEPKREARPIVQAPEGEGCPRCGGFVYAAEQMLARGRSYHKECFKCNECKKGLDSRNCCPGPDKEIYCKTHYGQKFGPKGYGYGQGAGALQSEDGAFGEIHAPRTTVVDTASIQAPAGQGCPRCGGAVFAAELVLAKGREWHRKCFKCNDCRRVLDSIIACDGPDAEVYCRGCYGKRWGPKGYGFACGSGFLQTDGASEEEISAGRPINIDTTRIKAPEGQGCPRCGGAVFAAEQMLAKSSMWHKKCFNCAECHRPLDSVLACDGPDKEIHCRGCYAKLFGPKGFGYGHTPVLSTNGESTMNFDAGKIGGVRPTDGTGCPRCGFVVYEAEKMMSKKHSWHKRCFNCGDCHKSLDSTNLCDGPNGEIYCRGCYGRNYGPRGVGFGMGAGCLSTV